MYLTFTSRIVERLVAKLDYSVRGNMQQDEKKTASSTITQHTSVLIGTRALINHTFK